MRIAVVGAGAIGSLLGALLSRAHEVMLIGRGRHLQAMKDRGLILKGLTSGCFHLPASERYTGGADLIILAVKAYDTRKALEEIAPHLKDEHVLTVQNGLDNWKVIAEYVGRERTFIGLTTYGAYLEAPGVVIHAGTGWMRVGAISPHSQDIAERIVAEFRRGGIEAHLSEDIMRDLWSKVLINACINPLTAILRVRNGLLAERFHGALDVLVEECTALVEKMGMDIDVREEVMGTIRDTKNNYSSMCQDVMAGRRTEIDHITGAMLRYAEALGVKMNAHRLVYHLVRSLPLAEESPPRP